MQGGERLDHRITLRRGLRAKLRIMTGTRDPFESLFAAIAPTVDPASEDGAFFRSLFSSRRLKKGEFFGEVGLVHGAPRMATVRVASNCDEAQTLVVSKEAFLRLVEPASRTRERVFRTLAQRMAANRG